MYQHQAKLYVQLASALGVATLALSARGGEEYPATSSEVSPLRFVGSNGDDHIRGTRRDDILLGRGGLDRLDGRRGDDTLDGGADSDTLTGGPGADKFTFRGSALEDFFGPASADGRQIVGNEDFITDFEFGSDQIALNALDFQVFSQLKVVSIDGNAGVPVPAASNVIILLNADNDNDPTTPFLAGTAANQLAGLVEEGAPGFFIYFNSNLQLNRLVYSTNLSDATADLKIIARFTDLLGQDAIDALAQFSAVDFVLLGDTIIGDSSGEVLIGGGGADTIDGAGGDDVLKGTGASDMLTGGPGADAFSFTGDAFDGVDVSAAGRQIIGGEDFISDFTIGEDRYLLNAADFAVDQQLVFQSLDANAPGTAISASANVVVLQNADNDNDPTTPFLAGTAANQIAALTSGDRAGFFVYFNSNLQLNRLVYSTNLADAGADLKVLARNTDALGQAAIDALAAFTAAEFALEGEIIDGGAGNDILVGSGGNDVISAAEGDDIILGKGGLDILSGGAGSDDFGYVAPVFDGADVSAAGRQIVGNEDVIEDFSVSEDSFAFDAAGLGLSTPLVFASVDANAPGASFPAGTNVIVLINSDNDNDPTTPFLAGTAANQIATIGGVSGPGVFIYFNSNLQLNRLVYSTDLGTASADLKILNRLTNAVGQAAIDVLPAFSAANFTEL